MAVLEEIWIDNAGLKPALSLDWDNDRHQRIVIAGDSPDAVADALEEAYRLVLAEKARGEI